MKFVNITEIFNIYNGNGFALSDMQLGGNVSFVSRGSENNGIVATVHQEDVKPFDAGSLTVALSGSVMESFYQEKRFYTAYHIAVLTPIYPLQKAEMLYYCMAIRANKYRYNYGRQANKTIRELKLPHPKDIPEWVANIKFPTPPSKSPSIQREISFDFSNWNFFCLPDIFAITRGERLVKEERIKGSMPLVTAGANNNGVAEFIDGKYYANKKKFKDSLTVDMFYNCFYQQGEYFSDDNVHTLQIIDRKPDYNYKFALLFIATIINLSKYKYAYGRQVRLNRLEKETIKLPTAIDGEPDWQFMEDYIKSLPYSANLE